MRSWLFVPGDSEKKLSKASGAGADVLVFDLEDSVAPDRKDAARRVLAAHLCAHPPAARDCDYYVRINALDDAALTDLAAVMSSRPDGIMLPKTRGAACIRRLAHYLDAFEAAFGIEAGKTRIIAIVNETARGALTMHELADLSEPRLVAMSWGGEDLAAVLGARTNQQADGEFSLVYRMTRANLLLAARAAGVVPIDAISVDFKDLDALRASSLRAAAEGFEGRLAIHPAQVAPINAAFQPSEADVAQARQVIAAFAAEPGAGVVGVGGKMFDRPHLRQAQTVLARAGLSA